MTTKRHYIEIDVMRAILIVLVILVHIVHFGDLHPEIKSGILSFMMPAFLFITGYLVNINKKLSSFCVYIAQIFLPYFIMVMGYMILSLYLPVRDGIKTFDLETVSRVLFVTSIGPYWFLKVMMVCGILYYISFQAIKSLSKEAKYCIFACLLIIVSQLTPLVGIKAAVYYFLGAGAKQFLGDFSKVYRKTFWAIIPFFLLIVNNEFRDWGFLSIGVSVVFFFCFTAKLTEYIHGKTLLYIEYIGRNTLPIYIFHPIFTMAAKYIVPVFSFDYTGILHAVVTIIISLAGCIGLGKFLDLTKLSIIFGRNKIMR